MLTLPAVIGAVAAPIPIRIHEHFGALSRNERKDMHRRVGVVDTLLVLVHGPLMIQLNLRTGAAVLSPGAQGSTRTSARVMLMPGSLARKSSALVLALAVPVIG
jgi:hypothetical protein